LVKILITFLLYRAIILAVAVLKAGAENSDIHRKSSKIGTFVVRFSLLIFIEIIPILFLIGNNWSWRSAYW